MSLSLLPVMRGAHASDGRCSRIRPSFLNSYDSLGIDNIVQKTFVDTRHDECCMLRLALACCYLATGYTGSECVRCPIGVVLRAKLSKNCGSCEHLECLHARGLFKELRPDGIL